jgi:hypothetical protein
MVNIYYAEIIITGKLEISEFAVMENRLSIHGKDRWEWEWYFLAEWALWHNF